jgi:NAD(P)-dependent dehydrogenase (short-subunit alcohol dehydrogenase family)
MLRDGHKDGVTKKSIHHYHSYSPCFPWLFALRCYDSISVIMGVGALMNFSNTLGGIARCGSLLVILLGFFQSSAVFAVDTPTVLITGSNRGIGLEFARQYAEQGWRVIATCRSPAKADDLNKLAAANNNIIVEKMDVTDAAQIASVHKRYKNQPLQLLINNAALLGPRGEQAFEQQDYELAVRQYEVNALGPMRVSQAFVSNVAAAGPGKIITLGSAAGSNGYLKPPADFYSYRASKAANHFLMHNLALELAADGIIVGLLNPGLVDTRGLAKIGPGDPVPEDFKQIVKLIHAGVIELTPPEESVAAMIKLIDGLTMEQSGVFLNYDGQVLPW